ncbi:hypothetical protein [Amycolatopsis sp. NPDC059657]|uniref:hypothetical protein n=1 Tax=Amycolatopsis sp. NPDC059657 TaxID=3346899 RepID=UPI003671C00D
MARKPEVDASLLTTYLTVSKYNDDFPEATMPLSVSARNMLRSFTCASAGLKDDLAGSGLPHTLEFLPGGAPEPGEADRSGTVVASCWGEAPYIVLAEQVSLRQAWEAVTQAWPAELSSVVEVLRTRVPAA